MEKHLWATLGGAEKGEYDIDEAVNCNGSLVEI